MYNSKNGRIAKSPPYAVSLVFNTSGIPANVMPDELLTCEIAFSFLEQSCKN